MTEAEEWVAQRAKVPSQLTAMGVVRHLQALALELDQLVKKIGDEDLIATVQREAYIKSYASSWRAALGSVEARKQIALALTTEERLAAEIADCSIRDLRRKIDALRVRIEVGRSMNAALRAELMTIP